MNRSIRAKVPDVPNLSHGDANPLSVRSDYLHQALDISDEQIVVRETQTPVMMKWELPLMRRMANIAAARRGDILEIGFGMGLSARAVQQLRPRSHTIVEAHPEIAECLRAWSAGKSSVKVIEAPWQQIVGNLATYDGIIFDVFGGSEQRLSFFRRLSELLRPNGFATLWLGDDVDLPSELKNVLHEQGFTYGVSKVSAIPDARCTYSRKNEFIIPAIYYEP